MNLLIITQYFLPEMGAPQNRLFELAKGLKNRGWNVRVVTAMPNYPTGKIFPAYRGKFSSFEIINEVPVKHYWLYASNSPRTLPRIISMVSFSLSVLFSIRFIRRNRPDYILVESPPLTLAFSAWILNKLSSAKLIMNVSDLWPLSAKELGAINEGVLYKSLERLERFLYNKAFICTGQSQEIVDHLKSRTQSHVYLFRNGVDTKRFDISTFGVTTSQRKIVYAGLLGVAQGIFQICKNMNFAEIGLEFDIYGEGAEKKAIEDFLLQHPDKGIYYKGMIPRATMPEILKQYDATLIPLVKNIYGAVPSKIYESMAAGLPIFFSGEGEGAQIVKENKLGWVNKPGDWIMLRTNLAHYFNLSPQEKDQLKQHCRQVAIMKFDREKQVEALNVFLSSYVK